MALQFINKYSYYSDNDDAFTLNKPTNTADGDLMFTFLWFSSMDIATVPAGWTQLLTKTIEGGGSRFYLYWKIAASEGTTYAWANANGNKMLASVVTFRGGFDPADPFDVTSNTEYSTSNTTVRAATMTVSAANSNLLFFGCFRYAGTGSFTPPSVPSAWTELYEDGDDLSAGHLEVCSLAWTGSGATGNMDATASATITTKHAFAIALNPLALPAQAGFLYLMV